MNVAIVGYGYWGRTLRRYIDENTYLQLVRICSPGLDENAVYTNNLDEILTDSSIAAVFVCTPTNTHYSICHKLLTAHKHVFCEKPATKTRKQFLQLKKIALEKQLVLYTDYIYLVSPSIRKMKDLLPQLGEVYAVEGEISQFGNFYEHDSVFEVIGIHLLSVIADLFAGRKVTGVSCTGYYPELPQAGGNIRLEYDEKIHISLSCNLLGGEKIRVLKIYGALGSLVFDMMGKQTLKYNCFCKKPEGGYTMFSQQSWAFDEGNNLAGVIQDFLQYVIQRDGKKNLEISETVTQLLSSISLCQSPINFNKRI